MSDGWTYGRVWEFGGLWDRLSWGRKPEIKRLNCGAIQQEETLWLHAVEDAVLMVEVHPKETSSAESSIGQVVLKRLIDADRAIEILSESQSIFNNS
nr:hypothetical protein [Waterburya agarophytonicola]